MPITERWWHFRENLILLDRDDPGVYEFGNAKGVVVYIGGSNALKRRLREHLDDTGSCVKRNAKQYRIEYTQNYVARERLLYDEHVRLQGKPPLCCAVRP